MRHPQCNYVRSLGLFKNLGSFAELESRIASLPTEKNRGDAFEVFAEAYLSIKRRHDFIEVWPLVSAPPDILRSLSISPRDYGVDGLLISNTGDQSVYQVKYRTGRATITWRDLATFFGLSDNLGIKSRILVTNCDDITDVANERNSFYCIKGCDFDRLDSTDFKNIDGWLEFKTVNTNRKQPRVHQLDALHALEVELKVSSRASCIMPCGSGKSLVALWHSERSNAKNILVLLPSLALLRQTLHEWMVETSIEKLAYICVCSDATVDAGIDTIVISQADLDFEVTTDASKVRGFLDSDFQGVKIVFSTYHSARVVGEAIRTGFNFCLGIFDEAHKTAGKVQSLFSYALSNENIKIKKRIFFTATPRCYNIRKKLSGEEDSILCSMDDVSQYGRQVYRLSFAEAVRNKIICGYKVIVSVITKTEIDNYALQIGVTEIDGRNESSKIIAAQIALKKVIETKGVSKIFTFHSTVSDAKRFVELDKFQPKLVQEPISTCFGASIENTSPIGQQIIFRKFHVNGSMSTATRENEINHFRLCQFGIMSNARCLTEGVDVPAVDLVAFISPKRSRIDIVQAAGRAMRRSPNKTIGYILVPIFLEIDNGESINSAVERSDFSGVWDVLASLQEQDDLFENTIAELQTEKGLTGNFDPARLREVIEFQGVGIEIDQLQSCIEVECLDRIGHTWDERFGQLQKFKSKFGHCRVPFVYADIDGLGVWLNNQRQRFKKETLDIRQIEKLEKIGVEWEIGLIDDEGWFEKFRMLEKHYQDHGHFRISRYSPETRRLGEWINNQRKYFKQGLLADYRIKELRRIGFPLEAESANEKWEKMFSQFQAYSQKTGGTRPTRSMQGDDLNLAKLATWCMHQRGFYARGELSEDRVKRLTDVGFDFSRTKADQKSKGLAQDIADQRWDKNLDLLRKFKFENGHCNVSVTDDSTKSLGIWVRNQRSLKRRGHLQAERIEALERIEFPWELISDQDRWDLRFQQLQTYHTTVGNTRVPQGLETNKGLGTWVAHQRQAKKKGTLSDDRIRRLESIGFEWTIR